MRIRLIFVALPFLHIAVAASDSIAHGTPDWVQRAAELGIESAHGILEYSLTDECDLDQVQVTENTAEDVFDAAAVVQITRSIIGPFKTTNSEIVSSGLSALEAQERFSMTNRSFNWNTDLGHQLIVCRFFSDGRFADAYYTDGHEPPAKTVENRPVARRLSQLGTRSQKVVFQAED